MTESFSALMIEEVEGKPKVAFKQLTLADLPQHDVLVEVACSTLNYKDGLAVSGRQKIVRKPPLIGGIDLAGIVRESKDPAWTVGERVIVNGWGLSEIHNGGYTRYQRVKPDWLVRIPPKLSFEQAMAIGTAGYTAALCVDALERWGKIRAQTGEVLVTGAAGGVGSVAVALLSKAGYTVAAATGREQEADYLRELGAASIVPRAQLEAKVPPLQKERWWGAVDSVGGTTLATVLSQTVYGGAVACCGLAGGADLPATVLPHILRGVALLGIDSVMAPRPQREAAWARLERDLDANKLAKITRVEPMSNLPTLASDILAGKIRGRVVIDVTR
jgi:putative YhdH/YhfP family quinone oxidoreductase